MLGYFQGHKAKKWLNLDLHQRCVVFCFCVCLTLESLVLWTVVHCLLKQPGLGLIVLKPRKSGYDPWITVPFYLVSLLNVKYVIKLQGCSLGYFHLTTAM